MIKDSGNRTEFESGAVRDIQEGKGRCDLLPLADIAAIYFKAFQSVDPEPCGCILQEIAEFQQTGAIHSLQNVLCYFVDLSNFESYSDMWLEVAKHFEEGALKYGENNWQKGIPVRCYIDSAVRHFFKYLREDDDERHDRAFAWNIICAIWTCRNMPELNDYRPRKDGGKNDSFGS